MKNRVDASIADFHTKSACARMVGREYVSKLRCDCACLRCEFRFFLIGRCARGQRLEDERETWKRKYDKAEDEAYQALGVCDKNLVEWGEELRRKREEAERMIEQLEQKIKNYNKKKKMKKKR